MAGGPESLSSASSSDSIVLNQYFPEGAERDNFATDYAQRVFQFNAQLKGQSFDVLGQLINRLLEENPLLAHPNNSESIRGYLEAISSHLQMPSHENPLSTSVLFVSLLIVVGLSTGALTLPTFVASKTIFGIAATKAVTQTVIIVALMILGIDAVRVTIKRGAIQQRNGEFLQARDHFVQALAYNLLIRYGTLTPDATSDRQYLEASRRYLERYDRLAEKADLLPLYEEGMRLLPPEFFRER